MDFSTWWKSVEGALQFGVATAVAFTLLWAMIKVWFRQTACLEKLAEAHTAQTEVIRQAELDHAKILQLLAEKKCHYPGFDTGPALQ